MIKTGKIKNMFGIDKMNINFTQKYTYGKDQEEQVINVGDKSISLIPTILAKNAAGKTSLIRSIDFVMRFSNKVTFATMVENIKLNTVFEKIKKLNSVEEHNIYEDSLISFDFSSDTKKVFSKLFKDISFIGSKYSKVSLELVGGYKIGFEASKDSFIIFLGKQKIDLIHLVEKIHLTKEEIETPNKARKVIRERTIEALSKINFIFYKKNYSSLFRDVRPSIEISELAIKHKTRKHILSVIDNLGFETLNVILKKLDSNIRSVKYDNEDKDYNIFIKSSDYPISSRNLSFGTQKVLEILYKSIPLFKHGGIMMIDEIENGLHLSLIQLIVSIFENPEINTSQAQLLMTTHNPLIGENYIVKKDNFFMFENSEFINIREYKEIIKRTSDKEKILRSKNYFNDLFWRKNNLKEKSTLSTMAINQIINVIQDGVEWQKK